MWIVRLALRRPYTFVVAALLLLLMTPFVLTKTPTDIFPAINIPVVSVIWSYTGLPADQIAQRLVYSEERALTTTVDNIEHIESTSYDSFGVIKVFFQQGTNPSTAVAQLTAVSQTILRQLPPGTTPPLIIQYSASTFLFFSSESAAQTFRAAGLRHRSKPDSRRTDQCARSQHSLPIWRKAKGGFGRSRSSRRWKPTTSSNPMSSLPSAMALLLIQAARPRSAEKKCRLISTSIRRGSIC
jgi:hypothetical protein